MPEEIKAYYIGVDVGTGSARACVINEGGDILATSSQDIQTWQPQTNCYEQSTNDIWRGICTSVSAAVAQAAVSNDSIRSIAFAATCSLAIFTHDTNVPVPAPVSTSELSDRRDDHNVLLWMHCAATKEAELINSTAHPVIRHLGGSISPLMALAKVLWLKSHMSQEAFARCKFFDLHDALADIATGGAEIMCGSEECQFTSQSRGFGVDGTIKGWQPDLLQLVGLGRLQQNTSGQIGGVCKHGQPAPIGTPIGTLCPQAAQELGLSTSVMVSSGVIDCYAGWIGTVGARLPDSLSNIRVSVNRRLALVAGTSACHVLASDRQQFARGVWGPYKEFLLPNSYTIVGGQSAVGHLLQHILRTHPAIKEAQALADARNQSIFDYLNDHLQRMQSAHHAPNITYLARHLFFYGDYFGNRSPIADPTMTGSISGLNGDVSIDNLALLYYAAMEFLALQTRHIISVMRGGDHVIQQIFMSGSLCRDQLFVNLLSTVCSVPVVLPRYTDAAVCYGSALLAATVSTHGKESSRSLMQTMAQLSKPGKVSFPDKDLYMKDLLDVKYTIFLEQAERQRVFRRLIDDVPQR